MATQSKLACLNDLKARILSLDLAPGADLDEASLSADYGISRTPLREVLQHLAGAGYLDLTRNRGAKVSGMDLAVMRTFFQTAPTIYANIAYLAAQNRTVEQLDTLRAHQADFTKATGAGDAGGAALANHAFHAVIGQMAHNPYLMACLDRLLIDHTRLSQTFYRPTDGAEAALIAQAVAQHDAMIAAIADQDAPAAMDLTLQHWDLSRDRLHRFVHPDPLPADRIGIKEPARAV